MAKTNPLSEEQAKQLLEVMIAVRESSEHAKKDEVKEVLQLIDPDAADTALQAQEQMNKEILTRAALFLNDKQLQSLTKTQTKELADAKAFFKMFN